MQARSSGAFEKARSAGSRNINLDLMWGLPEQTVEDALRDLDSAILLAPEHISWYQLTIEPKTEFAKRTPILPVESALADIEKAGLERLADAGYRRYEISAFARDGMHCRHNVNYWTFGDYRGIGAGAHGKTTGDTVVRTEKLRQPRLYLAKFEETRLTTVSEKEVALEYFMNALRLVDGTDWQSFTARTGIDPAAAAAAWGELADQGLVVEDRCAATPLGLRYLDSVLGRLA